MEFNDINESKRKVLITGAKGQLGKALKQQSITNENFDCIFLSKEELDITSKQEIKSVFNYHRPDVVINTAAYTAVDKAEDNEELAFLINATAVGFLAKACKLRDISFIHISTDYVFNGNKEDSYIESDLPEPQTVYGSSKLAGEKALIDSDLIQYAIIRTSWLYSSYGHNFVKTMLRLGPENNEISVVNDQLGSPTCANDLAEAILLCAKRLTTINSGIYHYSNKGSITWYNFANAIFKHSEIDVTVLPITSELFPTRAKRPVNSVLNTEKIEAHFQIKIPEWETSLKRILNIL